ncbi:hypothetical protein BSKO_02075 [Bryopsis sp. KO-2023]|nr:hypothetical protein BSKO_02075 [Bryopsis sp. KO-2023]
MAISWLPRSLSSFPIGHLVFAFIAMEVVLFVAFNLTNPEFDSVEDGGCSVGWRGALSSSQCQELRFRPTWRIPTPHGGYNENSSWCGPQILARKGDEKYRFDASKPWWICGGNCNATVVVWPVGSVMEQLQVIGTVLTLSKEEGFSVKVLRDPEMGYGWEDLFDYPRMDSGLQVRRNETEDESEFKRLGDSGLSKNLTRADGERIKGQFPSTQKVSWADGTIECEMSKVVEWKDMHWYGTRNSSKTAKCVRTKHLVVGGQSVTELDNTAWFLRALRPVQNVRDDVVNFLREQDWLKYSWTGVHVEMKAVDTGRTPTPDKPVPAEAYTQQMHRIFLTIPNHDLENWQVLKPMRFFMATDFAAARAVVKKSFRRGIVVDRWDAKSIEETPLSKATWDLINLLLLSSCQALIGTPHSLTSRAATLIGDSFYTEPQQ